MNRSIWHQHRSGFVFLMVMVVAGAVWVSFIPQAFAATHFQVSWAEWKQDDGMLKLKGYGAGKKNLVSVKDPVTGETLGTTRSEDDGKFEFSKEHLASVPSALLVMSGTRAVTIGFTKATRKRGGRAVLIRTAEWSPSEQILSVKGTGPSKSEVVFFGVGSASEIGSIWTEFDGRWRKKFENLSSVPCRIRIQTEGAVAEMAVKNAPENCGVATPPGAPLLTDISISGPSEVAEKSQANYTAMAAYNDGTTRNVTNVSVWQVSDATYAQMAGNRLTTLDVPADQVVVLTVTYEENVISRSGTLQVTILDQALPLEGSHANRFSTYEGTATCLACHTPEAMAVHGGVHYQWKGSTSETIGLKPGDAGKLGGINDFCIYPDINWIGKLTNISGQLVDGGCAKCHVGLGQKPEPEASANQLENIDCLVCHSEAYKRKVEMVDGAYRFVPDTEKMTVGTLQAAVDITLPSNGRCLNCHTKAGGGDNFKRGDLEEAHRNASRSFDVHLASKENGGAGLNCVDCHTAIDHRIAGRGTDLRPLDSPDEVSCEKCHGSTPHDDRKLNQHTNRVNCTVCHIPTFAKIAPTDMDRDWSQPGELNESKGLYEPSNTKMTHVIPEYRFFNGTSYFYQFGDVGIPEENGFITMSAPVGSITDSGARIYAFKHHKGNQPIDSIDRKLLPLKIGLFFQTGEIDQAVRKGVEGVGWPYQGYEFARTERFMGLFHEVAPSGEALSCTECHGNGGRMDFNALGYKPKQTYNGKPLCASCHEDESDEWNGSERFTKIHQKHVDDKKYDCSACHIFSKAQ
ncbi:MAG: hypothetical protein LJE96_10425 [Deltaproteobacteria bacterium]|nr:hypothetical protein [Deltaproteobacteria bacterium]